uniref:Transmembrane protein n=1 Tax=Candidatus Kentrum sp. DK TaxID=2126562 RepID=A0A450RU12_9GAMM|nr:MAG: hypothetical protein BECKDK2373B_GA0170837_100217 [Candidatus Kentron sp. DK]
MCSLTALKMASKCAATKCKSRLLDHLCLVMKHNSRFAVASHASVSLLSFIVLAGYLSPNVITLFYVLLSILHRQGAPVRSLFFVRGGFHCPGHPDPCANHAVQLFLIGAALFADIYQRPIWPPPATGAWGQAALARFSDSASEKVQGALCKSPDVPLSPEKTGEKAEFTRRKRAF